MRQRNEAQKIAGETKLNEDWIRYKKLRRLAIY